ncbi:EAL domain-containing protein (putative c-di-GMP-specific phosphodiesterase class I) [Thermocatellispora tengchongensis]|uniref:EAL domain-containing protein (Putative c-di-GMP-specific phosphodiesterase class I) n=1 Tax=Thermocatellispora tengchongensis TaxID=1073253 RepID=A0A840PIK2_9ACTN|nr:EAL domain-containing protein [Thermocatellispora tengchongensis]MBB5135905.1 EAL domain-containing protein (putative c-di-GMP-specific phosphodiesterase class I) [Thermocatellispora tengchongensis]
MPGRTPLLPPAEAQMPSAVSPIVDLDTGGVIALWAAAEPTGGPGGAPAVVDVARAALHAARRETSLPLVLRISAQSVIDAGSAGLAPLHEALRVAGRRPREVILTVEGGFAPGDRRRLLAALDGLRAIGYLVALGDVGTGHMPMDLAADAAPYLMVLSPRLVGRVPRDPRAEALGRSLAALARNVGAHVLVPEVSEEAQLAAVRSWEVRLAHGPLLKPGPSGRVHVPLPVPEEAPIAGMLGPRVQEMLLPAVTMDEHATAEEAIEAFGSEPSITSVILVDEYQRPRGSLDRSRFMLSVASRYGYALHGKKPAIRLADPPRTVPKTTPAIAAMQVAGRDNERVYDDLVVTDEMGRCMGILRVSDLIRQVSGQPGLAPSGPLNSPGRHQRGA